MVRKMDHSQWGEGIGGPVEVVDDANNPSFDAAVHSSGVDRMIATLCTPKIYESLTQWERNYITKLYGEVNLTRKQILTIWSILKKTKERPEGFV